MRRASLSATGGQGLCGREIVAVLLVSPQQPMVTPSSRAGLERFACRRLRARVRPRGPAWRRGQGWAGTRTTTGPKHRRRPGRRRWAQACSSQPTSGPGRSSDPSREGSAPADPTPGRARGPHRPRRRARSGAPPGPAVGRPAGPGRGIRRGPLPCTPSWSTASGVGRRPGRSVRLCLDRRPDDAYVGHLVGPAPRPGFLKRFVPGNRGRVLYLRVLDPGPQRRDRLPSFRKRLNASGSLRTPKGPIAGHSAPGRHCRTSSAVPTAGRTATARAALLSQRASWSRSLLPWSRQLVGAATHHLASFARPASIALNLGGICPSSSYRRLR